MGKCIVYVARKVSGLRLIMLAGRSLQDAFEPENQNMPSLIFCIVDVFAEEKYAGNQLVVVTEAESLSSGEMQKIAKEMHFSETTFILSDKKREDDMTSVSSHRKHTTEKNHLNVRFFADYFECPKTQPQEAPTAA